MGSEEHQATTDNSQIVPKSMHFAAGYTLSLSFARQIESLIKPWLGSSKQEKRFLIDIMRLSGATPLLISRFQGVLTLMSANF